MHVHIEKLENQIRKIFFCYTFGEESKFRKKMTNKITINHFL